MTTSSGGEAIVSGLVAHGVDTVFGLPGAQIYGLFDAFQQAQFKHDTGTWGAAFGDLALGTFFVYSCSFNDPRRIGAPA